MMLTIASFAKHEDAERLERFLLVEYGTSIKIELRYSPPRWIVYVDSNHPDWDTIRTLAYGFMAGGPPDDGS